MSLIIDNVLTTDFVPNYLVLMKTAATHNCAIIDVDRSYKQVIEELLNPFPGISVCCI